MKVNSLIRDKSLANSHFKVVDDKMIALRDLTIHIPFRFIPAKLADIGDRIMVAGVYAIISGDRYTVANFPAMQEITPSSITTVTIGDDDYYVFGFSKGEVISPRMDVVVDDNISYYVFDEFLGKAKLPWYFTYEDLGKCLAKAKQFGDINLASNNIPFEIIAATISRDRKNVKRYYREIADSMLTQVTNPPRIVPFRAIIENTTNTMGKLFGSYFDEGLVSALTHEGGPPGVEDLFRL